MGQHGRHGSLRLTSCGLPSAALPAPSILAACVLKEYPWLASTARQYLNSKHMPTESCTIMQVHNQALW